MLAATVSISTACLRALTAGGFNARGARVARV
jgi:hypothetical protein